jgi:hypothetical protein
MHGLSDQHEITKRVSDSTFMFQGSSRGCDLDALLALHDVTKLFMLRARECCLLNSKTHDYAFHDFKQLLSQASAVGSMRMSEASIHAVLVTVARGI